MEKKHYKLARSHRTGLAERELKPNPETRNRLTAILSYPTTQPLTSEEQDLLWRFRYYLAANHKALSKFVKCVNWSVAVEAEQAMELIRFSGISCSFIQIFDLCVKDTLGSDGRGGCPGAFGPQLGLS